MIYRVTAKFNFDKAREFHRKLTDGTIQNQRPDGPEIVSSMNRATIDDAGNNNPNQSLTKWTLIIDHR